MESQFGKDLTKGSIPKNLIKFALPILIGNILTTGYSIINAIWVGNLIGKDAVGAIAVSFPIFLAMVALCSGTTLATSLLISKAFGAKDYTRLKDVVNNSWAIAIITIPIVSLGGFLLSDNMLILLGTSEEIIPLAAGYLKISFVSFSGMYLCYLISSILRGIGNTTIPLTFIVFSTVLNAILDPILILGVGLVPRFGLNGAALASLLSTGAAAIAGLIYVMKKYHNQPINPSKLNFDKEIISEILKIGFPSFVQQILISMGYAFITAFVNEFGNEAIAAFGITTRLDSIIVMPAMAIMMATSTLTAQNLGTGTPQKIREVFNWGIVINIPVVLAISLLCLILPRAIMGIFVKDSAVIQCGVDYLRIVGGGYLTFAIFYVSNGIIIGAGKTITTMVISAISLLLIRIPLAGILSHTSLGVRGIWFAITISFVVTTLMSLFYYFFGRWNKGQQEGCIRLKWTKSSPKTITVKRE